jgi:hypothetical protein
MGEALNPHSGQPNGDAPEQAARETPGGRAREIGGKEQHRQVNAIGRDQDEVLMPCHGDDTGTASIGCSIAEILYRALAAESGPVTAKLPDRLLRRVD